MHRAAGRVAAAVAAGALAWPATAQAACWFDPSLTQQARQIAQRLMPELQKLPDVWVCTPEQFPARVDGRPEAAASTTAVNTL